MKYPQHKKTGGTFRSLERGLRQEIQEGLNVIENWNSANDFAWYGKGGEIAVNNREDQEIAILSLHLLQICLVYIITPCWYRRC